MPNKLDKLVVQLTADSTTLRRDLAGVNQQLDSFGQRANRTLGAFKTAAIAAFGVFSTRAIVNSLGNTIRMMDEMGKAAQSIGITTESLSALNYAAGLSGVSLDQLSTGLNRMSVNASDAARGTGEARFAFEALGISVNDAAGNLKNSDDLMKEVAARFATMEDGAGKTALAIKLFGRAGADMIPLLNQGADGIAEMAIEAEQLGAVIGDDMAKAAEQFRDNMTRLGTVAQALKFQIAEDLLPVLTEITGRMVDAGKEAGALGMAMQLLKESFVFNGALSPFRQKDLDDLERINREIENTEALLGRLNRFSRPGNREIQRLTDQLRELKAARDEVMSRPITEPEIAPERQAAPAIPGTAGGGRDAAAERALREAERAQQQFERSLQSLMDKLDPVAAKTRDYMTSVELLNRAWSEGQISGQEYDRLMAELASNTEDVARAQAEQREAMEALLRATIDAVDPTARLVRELQALDDLMQSEVGAGFGDVIMERMLQIHEEIDAIGDTAEETFKEVSIFAEQAARNMQDSLARHIRSGFDEGAKGVLRSFASLLADMAAQAAAANLFDFLGGKAGSGGVAGFLGGLIPGFATGTNYAPGGLALVGERGPEVVHLPRGSQVTPNNRLGGDNININVTVPPGSPAETRRAAAQGAREGVESMRRAQRYA